MDSSYLLENGVNFYLCYEKKNYILDYQYTFLIYYNYFCYELFTSCVYNFTTLFVLKTDYQF